MIGLSPGPGPGPGVDQGTTFNPAGIFHDLCLCVCVDCIFGLTFFHVNNVFGRSSSVDVDNPGNNLYVTGLSPRVTRRELEKHFAAEGKV